MTVSPVTQAVLTAEGDLELLALLLCAEIYRCVPPPLSQKMPFNDKLS